MTRLCTQYGYTVDAEAGLVFGLRKKAFKKRDSGGYIQAQSNSWPPILVHRIIWEAVHGPIPIGMQINHINGVKDDNRIANLELVTPSENTLHAYRLGLIRADGHFNGRAIGKARRARGAA